MGSDDAMSNAVHTEAEDKAFALAFVERLNRLILDDEITRIMVENFSKHRMPVLHEWAEKHPTIQCRVEDDGNATLGFVGLMNGVVSGYRYRIAATYDDSGKLMGFCVLDMEEGKAIR